ncbi:MAG TPA: glycosyltransferase [Chloroflexota bacterium]|nr:glycosyltransferase [Chloroflexota bacterium]
MRPLDILVPTINRPESLLFALGGVAAQDMTDFRLIVADQSAVPGSRSPVVQALCRVIETRGGEVEWHPRAAVHGIAEQRDFLFRCSRAPAVLYLDDDVLMEPWVTTRLIDVLQTEQCGFVGAFPAGLSYKNDRRPQQQVVEYWEGSVEGEVVEPDGPRWRRAELHRAANILHAAESLPPGESRLYKVAWIGACVLYDRGKLAEVGGFSFWPRLPRWHSGEEVLVQNLLLRQWGGCGILPSGTYFSEVETTVLNVQGTVDGHALDLLPEMVRDQAVESV